MSLKLVIFYMNNIKEFVVKISDEILKYPIAIFFIFLSIVFFFISPIKIVSLVFITLAIGIIIGQDMK